LDAAERIADAIPAEAEGTVSAGEEAAAAKNAGTTAAAKRPGITAAANLPGTAVVTSPGIIAAA